MALFEPKNRTILPLVDMTAGIFGKIDSFWVMPISNIRASEELEVELLPASCMFRMYKVLRNSEHLGYGFTSAFSVQNGGGFLLTRPERFVKPETYSVILRLPELVVYSFGNSGALAVSPKLSDKVKMIFSEQ